MKLMVLTAAGQWIDVARLPEVARLVEAVKKMTARRLSEGRPGEWDELELEVAADALRA
jgi:hypothetical protein